MTDFAALLGVTLASIEGAEKGSERIAFTATDGRSWTQYHSQDCCEGVEVEDVTGDVGDLIGAPILLAEEAVSDQWPMDLPTPEYRDESYTWTFYKLGTIKGSVTIRWYGSSNGYYSEGVDFVEAA
jgi:hypothetical protein